MTINFNIGVCSICGESYQKTSNHQKHCLKCKTIAHRMSDVKCRKNNIKRYLVREAEWRKKNPERNREQYRINPAYWIEWCKNNPQKTKVSRERHMSKHRTLGFIFLNESFGGSEGHHLDKEHILHIPKNLHRSVSHNVWTGRNMDKINQLAIAWYCGL